MFPTADDTEINLNALKNQDPFAKKIIDSALKVAVYKFLSKKNEWQKLNVEGSLFVFERMFEPMHSLAVMNTLALDLFIHPLTHDLEFQDRNPFLLYKSNNDIYGIWFIDTNDCERIKNVIENLTEKAKERRLSKKTSKSSLFDLTTITINEGNENTVNINNNNNNNIQIESSITATTTTVTMPSQQQQQTKLTSSDSIDIMQMLAKAQNSYVQSKTSDITDQPKPIGYHLNSNTCLKPEAIRIQPTSPKSSQQQEQQSTKSQPINPIIQRLLSYDPINTTTITPSASTSTLAQDNSFNIENNNELLSLEIKRKLNIIKLPSDDATTTTPHQKSINNIFSPSNSTKHLMTVKDFEANILRTESNDQPPSVNKHQMFYLEQSTTTHRPTKLQLFNENSNVSSKLKHMSSSNSESSHENVVSPTLPLLLTPAAFESQIKTQLLNYTSNNQTTTASALIATPNSNDLNSIKTQLISSNEYNNEIIIDKNKHFLTKTQLQQTLIHLLKTDDQFLNTIHEAYLHNNSNNKNYLFK